MRVVIQRVTMAAVEVDGLTVGSIKKGLLILLGIEDVDTAEDVSWIANKILNLRIFNDANGVMNLSLSEVNGDLLVVSQFTLFASTKKGNRPFYIRASRPDVAIPRYEEMLNTLETLTGKHIERGIFGADMKVSLVNDGPVTIIIDSRNRE